MVIRHCYTAQHNVVAKVQSGGGISYLFVIVPPLFTPCLSVSVVASILLLLPVQEAGFKKRRKKGVGVSAVTLYIRNIATINVLSHYGYLV